MMTFLKTPTAFSLQQFETYFVVESLTGSCDCVICHALSSHNTMHRISECTLNRYQVVSVDSEVTGCRERLTLRGEIQDFRVLLAVHVLT